MLSYVFRADYVSLKDSLTTDVTVFAVASSVRPGMRKGGIVGAMGISKTDALEIILTGLIGRN
jgi:hypothetical protein